MQSFGTGNSGRSYLPQQIPVRFQAVGHYKLQPNAYKNVTQFYLMQYDKQATDHFNHHFRTKMLSKAVKWRMLREEF